MQQYKLCVEYKQKSKFINYVQFYFDNWEDKYWYEVWLYPNEGIYLYEYTYKYKEKDDWSEIAKFEVSEKEKLAKHLIPLLQKLSKK